MRRFNAAGLIPDSRTASLSARLLSPYGILSAGSAIG